MSHKLTFHAHCGMTTIDEDLDREAARTMAASILRRRRASGHRCHVLEKGTRWEAIEPEDCMLVPDTAGLLCLVAVDDDWEDDDWDDEDWDNFEEDDDEVLEDEEDFDDEE